MPNSYYKKNKTRISFKWIFFICVAVLLIIAYFTVPSEDSMKDAVDGYVKMGISSKTANKEPTERDVKETFYTFNSMEYPKYAFFRIGKLHNRYKTKAENCCIGIFGITIPFVDFYDYTYPLGPTKHNYYRAGKKNPETTKIIGDNDYDTGVIPDEN